jgi:hypothetical protein
MQPVIIPGQGQSVLVPGKLNIVGEYHDESNRRREDEKKFAEAATKSPGYWTEEQFPGASQEADGQFADKAGVRALHSAAILAVHFQIMAEEADRVVKSWAPAAAGWFARTPELPAEKPKAQVQRDPAQAQKVMKETRQQLKQATGQADQVGDAQAAFTRFLNAHLSRVIQDRKYFGRTWQLDSATKEYLPVQAVFDSVDNAFRQYFISLYEAMEALSDSHASLLKVIPQLMVAADRPNLQSGDLSELENQLRLERSLLMGKAAGTSAQAGVWKVGEQHITDILSGTLDLDLSQLNVMTRARFNTLFRAWKNPPASRPKGLPAKNEAGARGPSGASGQKRGEVPPKLVLAATRVSRVRPGRLAASLGR